MELTEEQKQIMAGKLCPYCKRSSVFIDSSAIYGKSYGMIYLCRPCDAYVGVHKGTEQSLGRLANMELRVRKKAAHAAFDQIWQPPLQLLTRSDAYTWLSEITGMPPEYTHIGMFGEETCKKVIELSKAFIHSQIIEYGK